MKTLKLIVNLSDQNQKRDLMKKIGASQGVYEFTLKPYSARRSNKANAFWWACIVSAFQDFNEEQGVMYSDQQCHDILKLELLPAQEFVSPRTGEIVRVPADSHNLGDKEFSSLIERAIAWLAEMGVVVPDPEIYRGAKC